VRVHFSNVWKHTLKIFQTLEPDNAGLSTFFQALENVLSLHREALFSNAVAWKN